MRLHALDPRPALPTVIPAVGRIAGRIAVLAG
jgi:hypothetical protein